MVNLRVFQYRIPTKPYPVGRSLAHSRDGLLLRHEGTVGVAWAEAAPLPGWSNESIDDVVAAIREQDFDRYPSLQFAIDSLSSSSETGESTSVPMNALLFGTLDETLERACSLADSKFESVKLKVGRGPITNDIERIGAIRDRLRPNQRLRLDANRSWSLADATKFAKSCTEFNIEFIEEPLADPSDCERLYAETHIPYALDETVIEGRFDYPLFQNVSALIVKPTLIGGIQSIQQLKTHGIPLVFTSSFESNVGLARVAQLANRYAPGVPVGLDTHRWLLDNVTGESCVFSDGRLTVHWPLDIDESKLEEIAV